MDYLPEICNQIHLGNLLMYENFNLQSFLQAQRAFEQINLNLSNAKTVVLPRVEDFLFVMFST